MYTRHRAFYFAGLDPAGPGYTVPFDVGVDRRLHRSDARYVQCVYTARATFGSLKDCGHGNFIVNGGITQPGCITLMCSHSRAHELFNASLFRANQFYGEQCSNTFAYFMQNFLSRRPCSSNADRLGIYNHRQNGRFFVTTSGEAPFSIQIRT